MHATVLATGSALPDTVVTNADLATRFTTSDAWIRDKIGIHERRYAAAGQGVSDLALIAARQALAQAGLKPTDLDAILFATATPEYHAPGSGVLLQHKLGCRDIPAFDVRNTSPGFLYALELACGLIAMRRYRTVLVTGAEVHSTGLDFSERGRMMSVIFGDGAGCFILRATREKKGFLDFKLYSDGRFYDKLWCEGPSSLKNPRVSVEQIAQGIFFPQMNGRVVFENAVNRMGAAVKELLDANHLTKDEIDLYLCHQANLRIIETLVKNLGVPPEKVPHNIEKYGNTSSASIPILYNELTQAGRIRPGEKILLVSFGAGFCWGAGLLQT